MVLLGTRDEVQDFPWLKTLFKQPLTAFLSSNTSKFEVPPIKKVVSHETTTTFILADFEVLKRNLENAPKVLEIGMDIRGFDQGLTRV
jgi:hypothetical protein